MLLATVSHGKRGMFARLLFLTAPSCPCGNAWFGQRAGGFGYLETHGGACCGGQHQMAKIHFDYYSIRRWSTNMQ